MPWERASSAQDRLCQSEGEGSGLGPFCQGVKKRRPGTPVLAGAGGEMGTNAWPEELPQSCQEVGEYGIRYPRDVSRRARHSEPRAAMAVQGTLWRRALERRVGSRDGWG